MNGQNTNLFKKTDIESLVGFDEDEEKPPPPQPIKTTESVLSVKPTNEPFLRPSMIACQKRPDLIQRLVSDVQDVKTHPKREEPKKYILNIVHNRAAIDFSPYKFMSEKMALLDAAICYKDGNVITAVTIFLSKTLKESIFNEELQKRPIALEHYKSFLDMSRG